MNKHFKNINIKIMKEILKFKNLLFLSIFILLSSCGQTIDFDDDKEYIEDKNKVFWFKGDPYTGKLVKYYDKEKTQLQIEVFFKDGKRNGLTTENFENGFLKYKINYKDDERDGLFEYYYDNGQLREKTTYKDGSIIDSREKYTRNGQIRKPKLEVAPSLDN